MMKPKNDLWDEGTNDKVSQIQLSFYYMHMMFM